MRYPGKLYKFSDGTEVVVSPLTVGDYIALSTKYLSNITEKNMTSKMAEVYVAQYSFLVKEVIGQTFISDAFRQKFVYDYISDLYKAEDEKVLEQIERETVVNIIPIQRTCTHCGDSMEVYVNASLTFQQEV